ncbi:MAG: hypothetical protein HYV29_05340 [Ignavibacteriales bacterium]|nr:hypothetical protein [Ignavibacteriales bacterium]
MNDTILLIIISSEILIILAFAYVFVLWNSNKRIIAEHESKILDIKKEEERYRTLFENSVAGMMKFNYTTWEVQEANQTLVAMFNCSTIAQLQETFSKFPFEQFYQIESSLAKYGAVDAVEIQYTVQEKIVRRFLFSARREGETEIAHGVVVYITARQKIG